MANTGKHSAASTTSTQQKQHHHHQQQQQKHTSASRLYMPRWFSQQYKYTIVHFAAAQMLVFVKLLLHMSLYVWEGLLWLCWRLTLPLEKE